MERYLDSLPERDNSRSTTPSVPSTDSTSKPSTPVSITQTPADHSRSYEIMNSPNELSDVLKRTQNKYSLGTYNSLLTSYQPSSTTDDDGRDLWITSRSQANTLSSMTYPMPALKNGSPSNINCGLPPPSVDHRAEDRKSYNRKKSLEQQMKALRSQFSSTYDQGLSASTPNLTPRQVGFSQMPDESELENTQEKSQVSEWSILPSSVTGSESYSTHHSESRHSRYRDQSPMDDILNKYAIGPLPRRPMTAEDVDLPDSAQSTPGGHLKKTSAERNRIFRAKSTEFLPGDLQVTSSDDTQSNSTGYKYTSLRGILSYQGQSRSSSQLHTLQANTNSRLPHQPPTLQQYRTPPERIPAPKQDTPPRPHFVPKLQLKSVDIDLNQSDRFKSINSLADQEVARLSKEQAWSES